MSGKDDDDLWREFFSGWFLPSMSFVVIVLTVLAVVACFSLYGCAFVEAVK